MLKRITKVDFYMGQIPDKAGEGAKILTALKKAKINLAGFLGYHKAAKAAEVVLVVEEKVKLPAAALKAAGLVLGKKNKALLVTGTDKLGAVAAAMIKLAGAGINVASCHAVAAGAGRYGALVVVDPADLRKAMKALGR